MLSSFTKKQTAPKDGLTFACITSESRSDEDHTVHKKPCKLLADSYSYDRATVPHGAEMNFDFERTIPVRHALSFLAYFGICLETLLSWAPPSAATLHIPI